LHGGVVFGLQLASDLINVPASFFDNELEPVADELGFRAPLDLGQCAQPIDIGSFDSALKSFAARTYFVVATRTLLRRFLRFSGEEITHGVGFVGEDRQILVGFVDDKVEGVFDQLGVGPIFCALDSEQLLGGDVIDTGLKCLSAHHVWGFLA